MLETKSDKDRRIRKQNLHRKFNTVFIISVLLISLFALFKVPEVMDRRGNVSEIAQIMNDEGIGYKAYTDSLGHKTIGVGHLVLPNEKYAKITPHEALEILKQDYSIAKLNVERRYSWAEGDVKLVLINMSFQLGANRLHKFKNTLSALQKENYQTAAAELLDSRWARQTKHRAQRLAARILALEKTWW